jgi:AcrR family transcriptional regulator
MPAEARRPRRSQADRRAETRAALLAATARGRSRYGYGNANLAEVAAEAGYNAGARYHRLDDEDLALAVVDWAWEAWQQQVTPLADSHDAPFRRWSAWRAVTLPTAETDGRVMMTLRGEFAEREHPVGDPVWKVAAALRQRVERLIVRGRRSGTIPPGCPLGPWRRPTSRRLRVWPSASQGARHTTRPWPSAWSWGCCGAALREADEVLERRG